VNRISRIIGMQVIGEAADAFIAIEFIRKLKPDVVLMDMYLLNGTGIDVLKKIRFNKPVPKIIMMTGQSDIAISEIFKKAGVDYIFNKSLEFENIIQTLKQL